MAGACVRLEALLRVGLAGALSPDGCKLCGKKYTRQLGNVVRMVHQPNCWVNKALREVPMSPPSAEVQSAIDAIMS